MECIIAAATTSKARNGTRITIKSNALGKETRAEIHCDEGISGKSSSVSNLDLQTMSAEPGLTETIALFSTKTDMLMTSLSFKLCMAYLLTEPSDDIHDHMSQFFRTSLRLLKLDSGFFEENHNI